MQFVTFDYKALHKREFIEGAPTASIATGSVQADIFTKWFDHFIILLVLDGHSSYPRNIDVIHNSRNNNVTIVFLLPHSNHKMKPLDVVLTLPLKTYHIQEVKNLLSNNITNV
ncbi:hypothetical protein PR048_007291 [Dryococelus australis]|uniref:DDE-1 domain-containing protein n=1 Tax=Dryococelus australis TaxID=614101 RepID=A0ABQ9ID83_9NEOP|nr:hypothetical protein PR048_007291 [Dryococelus australis]